MRKRRTAVYRLYPANASKFPTNREKGKEKRSRGPYKQLKVVSRQPLTNFVNLKSNTIMKKPQCKYTAEKHRLSSRRHAISVKHAAGFIQKELSGSNVYAKQPKSFKFNSRQGGMERFVRHGPGSIRVFGQKPIRR